MLGLLGWCTAQWPVSVLFCLVFGAVVWSCVVPFNLAFVCVIVLFCIGIKGWEFLFEGRQGSIPWRSWRTGSVWGCSLP